MIDRRGFVGHLPIISGLGFHVNCNLTNGRDKVSSCAALGLMGPGKIIPMNGSTIISLNSLEGAGPSLG